MFHLLVKKNLSKCINQVVIMPLRETVHSFVFLLSVADTAGRKTKTHF